MWQCKNLLPKMAELPPSNTVFNNSRCNKPIIYTLKIGFILHNEVEIGIINQASLLALPVRK